MRITDRMVVEHTLYQLQQGRTRLGDAQTQVATGRRLLRSSDDPADVERAMTLASELRAVENQTNNLQTSRDWLNGTDSALSSFNDLLITARNLAMRAINDTNSQDERVAIGSQIGGLLENALAVANTSQGGYYLFSGHQVRTQPFEKDGNTIVYQGDNQAIRHMVEPGQTMAVNVTGVEGDHGGLLNGLTRLQELQEALINNDITGIQNFLENVDDVTADLHAAQSSIGARMQRVDRTLERLQQRTVDLKSLYSQLVDADMAETIAEMNAEQQAYEMSLATSARILPRSLLDFLR